MSTVPGTRPLKAESGSEDKPGLHHFSPPVGSYLSPVSSSFIKNTFLTCTYSTNLKLKLFLKPLVLKIPLNSKRTYHQSQYTIKVTGYLTWIIHKLSSYPELFMYDFKIKGHVSDFEKSEHVPDFKLFVLNPVKKTVLFQFMWVRCKVKNISYIRSDIGCFQPSHIDPYYLLWYTNPW